jgi:cell wall-associated NlpC family hydrolase
MSPLRTSVLALGLLAMACAPGARAARRDHLPPPAPVSRAGTRDPGAGPAPGSAAPPRAAGARPVQGRRPRDQAVRRAIETASALVGQRQIVIGGVHWGDGCAALVRAALAEAGSPLPDSARDPGALHAHVRARAGTRRSRPAPGDLVFLADRPGGPPEHVGLVESVAADGTALVLHHTHRGVLRVHVNGGQPWKARTDGGRTLNDVLLVGAGRVTAGRLLVGYATVL